MSETKQEVKPEVNPATATDATKKAAKGAPKIEYFGPNAAKVKFTVDPKATRIRVYENGNVLVDY